VGGDQDPATGPTTTVSRASPEAPNIKGGEGADLYRTFCDNSRDGGSNR
jgi:hypothetical protein